MQVPVFPSIVAFLPAITWGPVGGGAFEGLSCLEGSTYSSGCRSFWPERIFVLRRRALQCALGAACCTCALARPAVLLRPPHIGEAPGAFEGFSDAKRWVILARVGRFVPLSSRWRGACLTRWPVEGRMREQACDALQEVPARELPTAQWRPRRYILSNWVEKTPKSLRRG